MNPVLVLYATREGHTRLVADFAAAVLLQRKIPTRVLCAKDAPGDLRLGDYAAALLAASVHVGKYESELVDFVTRHRSELDALPTAFISVSMAEAAAENAELSPEQRRGAAEDVQQTIERFCEQAGWRPQRIKPVAGALLYTRYGVLTRLVMKFISKRAGGPTDTSRDYDFTDWDALARFTAEFAEELAAVAASQPAPAREEGAHAGGQ
jgi:menaquinone-dependent protoporphyrinogen oxidase